MCEKSGEMPQLWKQDESAIHKIIQWTPHHNLLEKNKITTELELQWKDR